MSYREKNNEFSNVKQYFLCKIRNIRKNNDSHEQNENK